MKKILLLILLLATLHSFAQVKIHVHLDSTIQRILNGRLYVFTSSDTIKGVPNSPDIANPQPMYAINVKDWHKHKTVTLDDSADAFSIPLSALKPGVYKIAGVVDTNPEERGSFNPGNYYSSKEARLMVSDEGMGETHLYLNKEPKRTFKENDSLKLVELKSELLSSFHQKDIFIKAAVVLPQGYNRDSLHHYPVVYVIPGWGGTHFDAMNDGSRRRYGMNQGQPKIYVYLNPETQSPFGLHCFIDSRVNGPWGKALVEELQVYIRKAFRASKDPRLTFVVGQSSGGYAALWLPLNYPKAFGGSWAVSPDPVDLSNFNGVALYAKNANMYRAADGSVVPFFLREGKPLSTIEKVVAIESFEGDGGQFQSFEAAFGKPDHQGRPKPLFDRKTGLVNKKVLKEWEPYDLGKYVQKNWKHIAAHQGGGKMHVYAGANDNFLLHRAVEAFKEKAEKVKADIVVELFPDADHFSMWNAAFTTRFQQEMDALIAGYKAVREKS